MVYEVLANVELMSVTVREKGPRYTPPSLLAEKRDSWREAPDFATAGTLVTLTLDIIAMMGGMHIKGYHHRC